MYKEIEYMHTPGHDQDTTRTMTIGSTIPVDMDSQIDMNKPGNKAQLQLCPSVTFQIIVGERSEQRKWCEQGQKL